MEFCWLEQWPLAVVSAGRPRAQGLTEGPAADSGRRQWPTRVVSSIQTFTERVPRHQGGEGTALTSRSSVQQGS